MTIKFETLAAIGTWELTLPELTLQWSDGARALLGQTLPETFAALLGACPEPDRLDVAAALSCPPADGGVIELEHRLVRGDDVRWLEQRIAWVSGPDGTTCAAQGVVRDITRAKVRRLDMARANERLATATPAGGVGVWDWDVPNNILVWDDVMYRLYGLRDQPGEMNMNLTKIFSLCLFTTALTLSACGGVEGDQQDPDEFESTDDALSVGGTGGTGGTAGTTTGWSSCIIRRCKNKCVDTYGTSGGPVETCKRQCDINACNVVF